MRQPVDSFSHRMVEIQKNVSDEGWSVYIYSGYIVRTYSWEMGGGTSPTLSAANY